MKNKNIFGIIIVLGLVAAFWLLWPKARQSVSEDLPKQTPETIAGNPKTSKTAQLQQTTTPGEEATRSASNTGSFNDYLKRKRDDPAFEWKSSITFYGKAIDENGAPVAGADVHFEWNTISGLNGISKMEDETKTDQAGLFSLRNKTGNQLSVTVTKLGYYTPAGERMKTFEYARPTDGIHHPNEQNPIVFSLRKRGTGTELITSESATRPDILIKVPRDGRPINVNLAERKIVSLGDLEISQLKPERLGWQQATQWSFRISVPAGGFVENNDEFPFEAPEAGYESPIELRFDKSDPAWATHLIKQYYIAFGQPRKYGWVRLETDISQETVFLKYAINPDGSRNLEPAEKNHSKSPPQE